MNNYEEMRIESDVFATARENFDLLMQRLFKSMEKNNSDEGSITLKVDLQMSQDWVPDGKGGSIEINKPVIKHKVSIAVPVKDSMDGKKDAGMNLVWDEEITDQEETNAPGGDTEATDSTDGNGDYEYEDPEEGMPE